MRRYCCPRTYFYPRPPRGGRPGIRPALSALRYFYPRPPRGGRPLYGAARQGVRGISIHALREEGDSMRHSAQVLQTKFLSTPSARRATMAPIRGLGASIYFYPRPPRGGRRTAWLLICAAGLFLSTPSARRATRGQSVEESGKTISIHALREEGDAVFPLLCLHDTYFYPRPPRGGRRENLRKRTAPKIFLSTPSARRATLLHLGS